MRLLFVFLSLLLLDFGYSQSALFTNNQLIEIDSNSDQGFIYEHKLKAKETIYSLSRIFKQSVKDIYVFNDKTPDYIFQIDEIVKIPFDPTIMTTDPSIWSSFSEKIVVEYQVKAQENLYRISREYFPQSMDHLMYASNLQSFNLSVNQKLIIGYISLNTSTPVISSSITEETSDIAEQKRKIENIDRLSRYPVYVRDLSRPQLKSEIVLDTSQLYVYEEEPIEYKEIERNGIALWDKKISDKRNLFVLHKSIKPGTELVVYYPLLQKSVKAQVVGNIPIGLYSKDVDLIISPKVAEKLSVRDAKFRVTVKYLKEVNS